MAKLKRIDSDDQLNEKSVTFVRERKDGAITRTLILSFEDWQEMGEPDEVNAKVKAVEE